MNSVDEHLEKAESNLAFLNSLNIMQDDARTWAVTVLFYHALHLASALIHHMGQEHGISHSERFNKLRPFISAAGFSYYQQLYNRSRLIRYDQLAETAVDYNFLFSESYQPLLKELQELWLTLTQT